MFKRFYNDLDSNENAERFADKVVSFNKNVSPAQIQGYFMVHKTSDQQTVIDNASNIWNDVRQNIKEKLL